MSEIILTEENFDEEVRRSDIPVLVDFWAVWCGPCSMIAPTVAEVSDEYTDRVKVGKVNVDEQMKLAMKYGVSSIPTLILFKNGEPVDRIVGVCSKAEIEEMIGR
ncbi:MAG: thioredoxin [Candidatus Alectryocaccobium sp.]|jgi:thioredoxin 1